MTIEAKVTSKGQVTLPVQLRERLGIAPGDHLVFVERGDGTFALKVRRGTLADLRGILHGKVPPPDPGELSAWLDETRGRAAPKG
jgi:antitoxin PrlF